MNEAGDCKAMNKEVNKADNLTDQVDPCTAHGAVKLIAPQLRVEELKEDGFSSAASDLDETLSDRDDHDKSPHAEKPYVPPTDELKEKIKAQVEFYFSDANILKDAFLLKHVKRNKQGYVSLKLITSFRKVKSLTKDYRVTAACLRESNELEVNEDGTKVKRKAPLPDYDETTPSRTIVAMNLPNQNPSIEEVAEMFSGCGEISLIRVLKPGKTIPADVKKHLNKHPDLNNGTCAVVEFENHESAKKACDTMSDGSDWRKGLSVTLLAMPKKDNTKNKKNDHKQRQHKNSGGDSAGEMKATSQADDSTHNATQTADNHHHDHNGKGGVKQRKDYKNKKKNQHHHHGHDHDTGGSDSEGSWRAKDQDGRANISRDSLSPQGGTGRYIPGSSPRSSPSSSPRGSPHMRRRTASHGKSPLAVDNANASPALSPETRRKQAGNSSVEASPSPSGSPWIRRRLKAQLESGNVSPLVGSPIGSPRLGRRLLDLEGVVRQPKGPEGPGFYGGKGRGKPLVSE